MIFVKYNSSNILTHSHSCMKFFLYSGCIVICVCLMIRKKINYMKNIFLWYFFSLQSSLARRRAPLYKHKTWLPRPPLERQQRSCTDLFLSFFFSSLHTYEHIHRHFKSKKYFFLCFSFTSVYCMCVCVYDEFTCAFAYYVAHFPSLWVHFIDVNYKYIHKSPLEFFRKFHSRHFLITHAQS